MTKKQRSGKQRKIALKEKRRLKREKRNNHSQKVDAISDSNTPILVKSFGGDIKDKSGPIPSIFRKELKDMVEKRRLSGGIPIDMLKRTIELTFPYNIDTHLCHPIRPTWSATTDTKTHEALEKAYFDTWCEQVCDFDNPDFSTPLELNLDVWRQLWRTLEQSDVIVLVVDIRNPLLHIPLSLVDDVVKNHKKKIIVVLTKIDLVSQSFTKKWINYLQSHFPQIEDFLPFTKQPLEDDNAGRGGVASRRRRLKKKPKKNEERTQKMVDNIIAACTKGYVLNKTPEDEIPGVKREAIMTIGCVGHPNVGKSCVLNAIIGHKELSVSRTAGHTKHIQHIFLDKPYGVCVMDCPGLIFPMKQPRYILECCGLCPIAQIRETMSAIRFLMEHIELERLYVLAVPDWYDEKKWSPLAIAEALGDKRGYMTSRGGGAPDVHRAGLEIIRDCVDGVVCLCFHPPQ